MINQLPKHIIRFILLIVFQVFMLNQIEIGGYINPMAYILWVLLLPIEIPTYLLLILAFGTGLTMDLFTAHLGIHSAATTLMAFFRPVVIRNISSKRDFEPGLNPSINDLGVQWFFTYVTILTLVHHSFLFFVESMSFSEFWPTIGRILLSSLVTISVIFAIEMIIGKSKKR